MVNSNWKCKTLQELKLSNCLQYSKNVLCTRDLRILPSFSMGYPDLSPKAGMVPGGIVARISGKVCAGFGQSLFFCSRPCPPNRPYRPLQGHFPGHGLPPFFKPCPKPAQTLPIK